MSGIEGKPLRILTVSNMYPSATDPVYGTFVKNFYEDTCRLNPMGHNGLVVIAGRRHGRAAKLRAYAVFYTELVKKLLCRKYDLIYVHTITFPTPALRIASLFRKLPLVFHVHGDDLLPAGKMKKVLKRLSAPLLNHARAIVSPSEYYKVLIQREFHKISEENIIISPSGGVAKIFFSEPLDEKPSDAPETLHIGYVSRIAEGKGWDTFVNALAILKEKGVRFHATMAGSGPMAGELSKLIAEKGLEGAVEYIGPVAPAELPGLYKTFSLFAFPTTRVQESLGLVGLEAMAAGVPVVASNMAGPAGYVRPGENGFLYEPGNEKALAGKIMDWVELSSSEKLAMREKSYRTALEYESDKVSGELFRRISTLC